ncbi:MAG: hypothetical protein SF029_26400 [bacterium]|nr:hypothetical protein [bacterium]
MDARALYQQGVIAIREQKDLTAGRQLLLQSLRMEPENDMAWLWLSRALSDPARQRQAVERALAINPENAKAQQLLQRFEAGAHIQTEAVSNGAPNGTPLGAKARSTALLVPVKPKTPAAPPAPGERKQIQIAAYIKKAIAQLSEGDEEGAIEHYVRVLQLQVDHEVAMREAVRYLVKNGYEDDAKELIWRAIDAGTQHPSIFITALDFARRDRDNDKADALRHRIAQLPDAPTDLVLKMSGDLVKEGRYGNADALLREVLESRHDDQKILLAMGELQNQMGRPRESMIYYNRAAKLGVSSKEGREADKRLANFAPVLTDRERGSVVLAVREAAAIGVFFLLLAWQDSGLNVGQINLRHWAGVVLSVLGGYLLVTATSSPQQNGLAALLGGTKPKRKVNADELETRMGGVLQEPTQLPIIPVPVRIVVGVIGAALVALAFWWVFSTSLELLFNPVPPFIPDPFAEF